MDEERNEVGKLHLVGCSDPNSTFELPKASPAGTDQVVWRDKEKVGENRENHHAQPPVVLTNAKACRDDFEDLIQEYRGDNEENEKQWSDTSEEIKDEEIMRHNIAGHV